VDIAIIGSGAIGGYYGARLAHAGHDVHFLARSEYRHLRRHGLRVQSHLGDFSLPEPRAYPSLDAMPPADLVCVTVKTTANPTVLPALGPILKPGAAIVLMQNGIGYEPRLAALYPDAGVYAGLCFICSFRDGPGTVRHTAYGRISLASQRADAAGLARVADVFASAGIETETRGDVLAARLRKLVWNIPFNGLSVVLDCTTAELGTDPSALALCRALMVEVVRAAGAVGSDIEPEFVDQMQGTTQAMSDYQPSMKLDYLAGRPMEIEAIYWNVIRLAREHGCEMPGTAMLARQLEFLERRGPGGGGAP
jgi:2-dehydropantoate 2-reductase